MIVVVDTSVLIDHLRGDGRATAAIRLRAESADELWSVTPVRTEILAGARTSELPAIRSLFAQLRWIDITSEVADAAGELAATYLRSYPGIDTVDYLIAGAVDRLSGVLLTLNVRHFPMFPDLAPAY